MKNFLFPLLLLLCAAGGVQAQKAPASEPPADGMKKLDVFIGRWEGTGWRQIGPKREYVTGSETAQPKLGGAALLIEGQFADEKGEVKHDALGVISYDAAGKRFRFNAYLANGQVGEYELKVLDAGRFEWGSETPQGQLRFSVHIENDTWFEIGEFSRDGGKTWVKMIEMNLKRVK